MTSSTFLAPASLSESRTRKTIRSSNIDRDKAMLNRGTYSLIAGQTRAADITLVICDSVSLQPLASKSRRL
jgi:hypothetical protein